MTGCQLASTSCHRTAPWPPLPSLVAEGRSSMGGRSLDRLVTVGLEDNEGKQTFGLPGSCWCLIPIFLQQKANPR
jgi:hypothetical protein